MNVTGRPAAWLLLGVALGAGMILSRGGASAPLRAALPPTALEESRLPAPARYDVAAEAGGAGAAAAAAPVLRSRTLRFLALADGREAVLEGEGAGLVHMLPADKSRESFLRVSVRILQEGRQARHLDLAAPYLLQLRSDDGLVLEDPLTTSRLTIRAFGTAAVAALSPLLTAPALVVGALPARCSRLEC